MEYEDADRLLEEYGWVLECWSPFEISLDGDPQSRATGHAADIVLAGIVESEKIKAKRNKKRRQQKKKGRR